jgi:hypothetical protein
MSQLSSQPDARIPRWLVWVGSLAIIGHFGMLTVNALAAPSGPWPDDGIIGPPFLAAETSDAFARDYLGLLRLSLNYHLFANREPANQGVYLEFRLKDEQDKELARAKLPDDDANVWVRHRQLVLIQIFASDQLITPPLSEVIAAPGREVPTVQFWEEGLLRTTDINQIPRNRPVFAPSQWTFLFARSYARYLCRQHGAAKVEVLRHHQDPMRPNVLTREGVSAKEFEERISNFGEFAR